MIHNIMPRFYCPTPLVVGALLDLPDSAARHAQVLRLQPGDAVTLFNGGWSAQGSTGNSGESGESGEFSARIVRMGRASVQVQIDAHHAIEREAPREVHLAVGMPANERMDWLVEKATELGVASIQPLMTERSVLRLTGERAQRKTAHWHSIAIAACEQCGGNRVPLVHPALDLRKWLQTLTPDGIESGSEARLLLSLSLASASLQRTVHLRSENSIMVLSGPEGGFSVTEETAAIASGFTAVSLGARILRAETAALTALAQLLA
jgi:16S rRNA (uracil1498-N3)-methyltransferase